MRPSPPTTATTVSGAPSAWRPKAAPTAATPRARLASGPAAAIQPSARADRGSWSSRAIPPSAHSSMAVVPTSKRRATTAWASSWTRIEAKKAMTPKAAATNPRSSEKTAASRAANTIALQWTLSAAPASRPREIDPVSIPVLASRLPAGSRQNDSGAISPAGPPDAGARERRRAREVEPGHGRLVASELRIAVAEGGERPAAEARRVPRRQMELRSYTSGVTARQSTIVSRNPGSQRPANTSNHRCGSAEPAHPPGRRYGVSSTSMLSTCRSWRGDGRIGQRRDVDQHRGSAEDLSRRHHRDGPVHLEGRRGDRERRTEVVAVVAGGVAVR